MEIDPQIIEIEQRAKAAGLQMAPILRDADVAATTWWRWRNDGVEPKVGTLRRVREALDRATSRSPSSPNAGHGAAA